MLRISSFQQVTIIYDVIIFGQAWDLNLSPCEYYRLQSSNGLSRLATDQEIVFSFENLFIGSPIVR